MKSHFCYLFGIIKQRKQPVSVVAGGDSGGRALVLLSMSSLLLLVVVVVVVVVVALLLPLLLFLSSLFLLVVPVVVLVFNSISFSLGRSSTPERDFTSSIKDKVIFSSSGVAPLSKLMSVMLEPSTRKEFSFWKTPFLKVSLLLVYATCRSLIQSKMGSLIVLVQHDGT